MSENKNPVTLVDGKKFERIPIKTCLVTEDTDLIEVLKQYAAPILQKGDILFLSEKMVACSQGRTLKLEEVKVSKFSRMLAKFVEPTYSEGLGLPQTMQAAVNEVGAIRILFAAAAGALGKLLKRRGWFYIVAGTKVSHIDGPSLRTIPPYDQEIVLSVLNPDGDAKKVAAALGTPVVIVDANPISCTLCGSSDKEITEEWIAKILSDNPLGQSTQKTPCGIIRAI